MNDKKNIFFIIDMQNDFCLPGAPMYVPGAENDVKKVAGLIKNYSEKIDSLYLTQDDHHVIDISHPYFWRNASGDVPKPFTEISVKQVLDGKWIPSYKKDYVVSYLQQLDDQGEFPHIVWPEHCITGSVGAAIHDDIMESCKNWSRKRTFFKVISKGLNPYTEHFGAFRANIPIQGSPETQMNIDLVEDLLGYEQIIVVGEAKSHCVANTIKQTFGYPGLVKKLVILTDCMSNIPGFEHLGDPIYKQAGEMGANLIESDGLASLI